MGDLDDLLQLVGKEKSHMDRDQVNREVILNGDVLIQDLPDIQGVVSRCIVMVKLPQFVLSQLSSLLAHRQKYILQDLLVDLLPYCLALLQELIVHSAPQHDFDHHLFFNLGDVGDFYWLLWCLLSGLYLKIHISSPAMIL